MAAALNHNAIDRNKKKTTIDFSNTGPDNSLPFSHNPSLPQFLPSIDQPPYSSSALFESPPPPSLELDTSLDFAQGGHFLEEFFESCMPMDQLFMTEPVFFSSSLPSTNIESEYPYPMEYSPRQVQQSPTNLVTPSNLQGALRPHFREQVWDQGQQLQGDPALQEFLSFTLLQHQQQQHQFQLHLPEVHSPSLLFPLEPQQPQLQQQQQYYSLSSFLQDTTVPSTPISQQHPDLPLGHTSNRASPSPLEQPYPELKAVKEEPLEDEDSVWGGSFDTYKRKAMSDVNLQENILLGNVLLSPSPPSPYGHRGLVHNNRPRSSRRAQNSKLSVSTSTSTKATRKNTPTFCPKPLSSAIPSSPSSTSPSPPFYSSSSSSKSHKCHWENCGKIFTRASNLKTHFTTHSKEKSFQCKTCLIRFARIHDMKRHERCHTKDLPYQCELCLERFVRNDPLWRHYNKCHPNDQRVPRPRRGRVTIAAVVVVKK